MLFGIACVFSLYVAMETADRELEREANTREAAQIAGQLATDLFDAGRCVVEYTLTKRTSLRDQYESIRNETPALHAQLKSYRIDDPVVHRLIDQMSVIHSRGMRLFDTVINSTTGESVAALSLLHMREEIYTSMQEILYYRRKLADELREHRNVERRSLETDRQIIRSILAIELLASLLMTALLFRYFARDILHRLRIAHRNMERIALHEPMYPALQGSDEISELDRRIHRMATELEESRKREAAMLDNAADVICAIDRDYNFSSVSQAVSKVWKYKAEELIGECVLDLVEQSDRAHTEQSLKTAFEQGGLLKFENRIIKRDRAPMDLSWSVFYSESEQRLFCVAHDIAERKRAEQLIKESELRIREMMANSPVGLLILDSRGTVEYLNETLKHQTAFKDADILGKPAAILLGRQDKLLTKQIDGSTDLSTAPVIETEILGATGISFPAEVSVASFVTGDEAKQLITVIDVSARHEIEQLKREFVAMISHDLRTPLNSLHGTLTLFQAGAYGQLNCQGTEQLEQAEREIERLINLIGDLLSLEKIKAGKYELNYRNCQVHTLVCNALDRLRASAKDTEIILQSGIATDLTCDWDPDSVTQILISLLSNAIKVSPDQGTVTVSISDEAESVRITVTDHGPGLSPILSASIFDRIEPLENQSSRTVRATGLGLAICKALVELHGGEIGVESKEDGGTSFWLLLPKQTN